MVVCHGAVLWLQCFMFYLVGKESKSAQSLNPTVEEVVTKA